MNFIRHRHLHPGVPVKRERENEPLLGKRADAGSSKVSVILLSSFTVAIPSWMFTLTALQHFGLVLNSGANFVIYCIMGTK